MDIAGTETKLVFLSSVGRANGRPDPILLRVQTPEEGRRVLPVGPETCRSGASWPTTAFAWTSRTTSCGSPTTARGSRRKSRQRISAWTMRTSSMPGPISSGARGFLPVTMCSSGRVSTVCVRGLRAFVVCL
ncbi:FeS_assembly_P domain-containing protein [Psidium guajava]|nr:FeS_assembly_P domain-containing protein [Psidium guajava]